MEATTAHGYHSPGASGLSPGLATRRTWRTAQAHVNTGGRRSWDPCTSAGPAAPRTGATPLWRPRRSSPPPPAPPPPPPARREAAALVRMRSPPPPPPSRWHSPTRQGSRAARHGAVPAALVRMRLRARARARVRVGAGLRLGLRLRVGVAAGGWVRGGGDEHMAQGWGGSRLRVSGLGGREGHRLQSRDQPLVRVHQPRPRPIEHGVAVDQRHAPAARGFELRPPRQRLHTRELVPARAEGRLGTRPGQRGSTSSRAASRRVCCSSIAHPSTGPAPPRPRS